MPTFSKVWISESKTFTKVHDENDVKNGKFHSNFHPGGAAAMGRAFRAC